MKKKKGDSANILTYQNIMAKEKEEWDNIYMHEHLSRKRIGSCAEWDVRKDLNKSILLANGGKYPDTIEGAVTMI